MPTCQVRVFDMVGFIRHNERLKCDENFVAIWMKMSEEVDGTTVAVHFAKVGGSEFAKAARVGKVLELGFVHRETYDESDHPPPMGFARCPRRVVMTYPKLGGFKSDEIAARREAKKQARLKKLGWS